MKYLILIFSLIGLGLNAQDVTLERYAVDTDLVPRIESLDFISTHGRSEDYCTEIQGQKYFWISGTWFGNVTQDLFQPADPALPAVYKIVGSKAYPTTIDDEFAIMNQQLKPSVMQDPYSIKIKDGLTLIDRDVYDNLVEAYSKVIDEKSFAEYQSFAKALLAKR